MHIPTNTTIYIDAAGTKETRTIMRAELVAIHTVLAMFSTHDWICIFTNSLSSLQAIRHHHTNPGTTSAKHYHHNRLLLDSITDLLETRRLLGLRITLHKIRAHTNIRGNDLANAAAKLAVTHYDTHMIHSRHHKHGGLTPGKLLPVLVTRSCTRLTRRRHCRL